MIAHVPFASRRRRPECEGVMRAEFGEYQVGATGAGEDAVDGEVADFLKVTELGRHSDRGCCRAQGAEAGQHPPAEYLQPLACQEKAGRPVVGVNALQGYQLGGVGHAGASSVEPDAVDLAKCESGGNDG
ncbi:hypothetical protein [Streptomyces sp. NPDC097640]|uniref:hypothetical protein n=1 Tax=Streptomyces sp. NPDC097640 TaxID=3157229 RepID=UPI0033197379